MLQRLASRNFRPARQSTFQHFATAFINKPSAMAFNKMSGELTPAVATFLAPMAAMALALGIWALAAQAAIASNFPITNGALADWRVWLVIAGALEIGAYRLRSHDDSSTPPRQ